MNRLCDLATVGYVVMLTFACTVSSLFTSANADPPDDKRNLELIRSLNSAVQSVESLPAFDVAGATTVTEDFNDGNEPLVQSSRFRMQVDHQRELLHYVSELRTKEPFAQYKPGESRFFSILINGKTVHHSNAMGARPSSNELDSFDAAIADAAVPAPGYWGLFHYPYHDDGPANLQIRIGQIAKQNATVTAMQGDRTVRYVARIDHEPNVRFDILHWEFMLPTFQPTFFKVERAAVDGRVATYVEQKVHYTLVDGYDLPNVIDSTAGAIKRGPKGVELGKRHYVTQFKWLRVGDGAVDESSEHLTTQVRVRAFLDEGAKIEMLTPED